MLQTQLYVTVGLCTVARRMASIDASLFVC